MPSAKSYRDLEVWRAGMDLAVECYAVTEKFPKRETYGLVSQIQRAATSIPANIAEGAGRMHTREYIYHASVARGSLFELETLLILSQRTNLLDAKTVYSLLAKTGSIGRMLFRMIESLQKRLEGRTD